MNLAMPKVQEDEIYAGILIKEGVPSHHLILLPSEAESVTGGGCPGYEITDKEQA